MVTRLGSRYVTGQALAIPTAAGAHGANTGNWEAHHHAGSGSFQAGRRRVDRKTTPYDAGVIMMKHFSEANRRLL